MNGIDHMELGISAEDAARGLQSIAAAMPTAQDMIDGIESLPSWFWEELDRTFTVALVLYGRDDLIRELVDRKR